MKKIFATIVFSLALSFIYISIPVKLQAQATVTTLQSNVMNTMPGDTDVPIIIVKVNVTTMPYSLYTLFLSTNGSTNAVSDISNAKVFYTGNGNLFSSANQIAATIVSPNGNFTIVTGPNFQLLAGDNYFWVTYDVQPTAIICDSLDAACGSVYGSNGTIAPVITDPPGYTMVGTCGTSTAESTSNDRICRVYPNPIGKELIINMDSNQTVQFILYNFNGDKIIDQVLNETINRIDLSSCKKGMYFYQIFDRDSMIRKGKLIKE